MHAGGTIMSFMCAQGLPTYLPTYMRGAPPPPRHCRYSDDTAPQWANQQAQAQAQAHKKRAAKVAGA